MSFEINSITAAQWLEVLVAWDTAKKLYETDEIIGIQGRKICLISAEEGSWEKLDIDSIMTISLKHFKAYKWRELEDMISILQSLTKDVQNEKTAKLFESLNKQKDILLAEIDERHRKEDEAEAKHQREMEQARKKMEEARKLEGIFPTTKKEFVTRLDTHETELRNSKLALERICNFLELMEGRHSRLNLFIYNESEMKRAMDHIGNVFTHVRSHLDVDGLQKCKEQMEEIWPDFRHFREVIVFAAEITSDISTLRVPGVNYRSLYLFVSKFDRFLIEACHNRDTDDLLDRIAWDLDFFRKAASPQSQVVIRGEEPDVNHSDPVTKEGIINKLEGIIQPDFLWKHGYRAFPQTSKDLATLHKLWKKENYPDKFRGKDYKEAHEKYIRVAILMERLLNLSH